jgi:hypothetical protein
VTTRSGFVEDWPASHEDRTLFCADRKPNYGRIGFRADQRTVKYGGRRCFDQMGDEPMVESTWERDAQVMEAIRSFERDRPDERTGQRLSELTDLDQGEIDEILVSLADADYVHARDEPSAAELHWWWDIRLRERGRRAIGQWPSEDPAQALIQLLEERIALTEGPCRAVATREGPRHGAGRRHKRAERSTPRPVAQRCGNLISTR